jgi:hypothetical protein
MWCNLFVRLMLLPAVAQSQPAIEVSSMFRDHAVLQREMPVRVLNDGGTVKTVGNTP